MRVFVSYNNRDEPAVGPIVRRLERLRPGVGIYFAPSRNRAGAYWINTLGEELAAADAVLLFVGRNIGPWQEIEYYEALRRGRKDGRPRIVPVLLEDEAPGLHFLSQLHRLKAKDLPTDALLAQIGAALDGVSEGGETAPLWRETNPYLGLFSMGTSGAAFFFGREALTGDILDRLRRRANRVQVLVGNSGVGKSSIVQAGVIAALRSQVWPVDPNRAWPGDLADSRSWLAISMTPGKRPLKSLALAFAQTWIDDPADREAQALKWVRNFAGGSGLDSLAAAAADQLAERADADAPARILLNIDQAEELYVRDGVGGADGAASGAGAEGSALPGGPTETQLFSRLVAESAGKDGLVVIASVRSDYYGRLQEDSALFTACDRIDVPPLTMKQVEEVIRKPVEALGARFETPEIVPMIAGATAREAGSLPLLSYMMAQAWDAMRANDASDGVLRFPLGVVDVARPLVDRAELFLQTRAESEDALRRLFILRVAHVPKEGEPVRRRARKSECRPDEWELAEELAGSGWRLLATGEGDGDPTAEVAHEALLRKWPRLAGWLDEARGFLIWKGQLEGARLEWEAAPEDRKDAALLMGLPLETAARWREVRGGDLPKADAAFIDKSVAAEERRKAEERRRTEELEAERLRSEHRRRMIARVSGTAAVVSLCLLGAAGWQWWEAGRANTRLEASNSQLQTANTRLEDTLQELEISNASLEDALGEAEAASEQAMFAADQAAKERNRADSERDAAEREASRASAEADRAVALQLATLAERVLDENPGEISVAAMIAADSLARTVTLAASGVLRAALVLTPDSIVPADDGWADAVTFSADGGTAAWTRRDVDGRDAEEAEPLFTDVALLDASTLATEWMERVEGGADPALSPDGEAIAIGGAVRGLAIRGVEKDGPRLDWDSAGDAALLFSDDGATLLAVHEDGRIEIRTAPDWGLKREVHYLATGGASSVTALLVSGGEAVLVLEKGFLQSRITLVPLDGGKAAVLSFDRNLLADWHDDGTPYALDVAGSWAAASHDDASTRVWNLESLGEPAVLRTEGARWLTATSKVSSTGMIATAANRSGAADGGSEIALWSRGGAAQAGSWTHGGLANALAFSPDGAWLAAAGQKGISARRVDGGEVIRGLAGETVVAMRFEAGGRLLLGCESGRLLRYDLSTGEVLAERVFGRPLRGIAADRDGKRIAVSIGADSSSSNWTDVRLSDQAFGARLSEWSWNGELVGPELSPDGSLVAAKDWPTRDTLIWNAGDGRLQEKHAIDGGLVGFDPSGRRLIVSDGKLALHDVDTGVRLGELGEQGGVAEAYWSADGVTAVAKGLDGSHAGWNLLSGEMLWRVNAGGAAASGMRSADGRLAAHYDEGTERLTILDSASGDQRGSLRMPRPFVAALSDDGSRLLASRPEDEAARSPLSERNLLTLWDVGAGAVIWSEEVDGRVFPPTLAALHGGDFVASGIGTDGNHAVSWLRYFPSGAETAWKTAGDGPSKVEHLATDVDFGAVLFSAYRTFELRGRSDGRLIWRQQRAFPSGTLKAVFLPGGAGVAVAERGHGEPGLLRVLDLETGSQTLRVETTGWTSDIAAFPDGASIILALATEGGGTLSVVDVASGTERQRIALRDGPAEIRALSDSATVAVRDSASVLETWNVAAGEPLRRFPMTTTADDFAHASQAARAVTLNGDVLRLWDTAARKGIAEQFADGEIDEPRISPDGTRVAYEATQTESNSAVMLWEPEEESAPRGIPSEDVRDLRFSPDGERLFVQSGTRQVRVYGLPTLADQLTARALKNGEFRQVLFSGDGAFLILRESGKYGGRGMTNRRAALRAFDIATGREVARIDVLDAEVRTVPGTPEIVFRGEDRRLRRLVLPGRPLDLTLSDSGDRLHVAEDSGTVLATSYWDASHILDPGAGTSLRLTSGDEPYNVVAGDISQDGGFVILSLRDRNWTPGTPGEVVARDTRTGAEIARLQHETPIHGVTFASASVALLSELGGSIPDRPESQLIWWNWQTGHSRALVTDNPVTGVEVSPDGRVFATAEGSLSADDDRQVIGVRQVRIWDTVTGVETLRVSTTFSGPKMAFSRDGRFLAVAERASALVIDLRTGRAALTVGRTGEARTDGTPHLVSEIIPNKANWLWPGFAGDGRTVVFVTEVDLILHDLASGATLRPAEAEEIKDAAFSADGRFAALRTGGGVRVWDLAARALVAAIPLDVQQLAFAGPDDASLLAVAADGVSRLVWLPADLARRACRAFSDDEWNRSRFRLTGATDSGPCPR